MRIGKIADAVAAHHGKSRDFFVAETGEDLVIAALNEARKELERDYDFFYQQAQVWLSVDPTSGALLSSAKLFDGTPPDASDTAVSIKSVETVYLYNEPTSSQPHTLIPVYTDSKKLLATRAREKGYRYGGIRYPSTYNYSNYPFTRYPGYVGEQYQRGLRGYYHGGAFLLDPAFDAARYVVMDVSAWMQEYTADQVLVVTASTSTNTITLAAEPPTGFGVGRGILGTHVIGGSGTGWTLADNANQNISKQTFVHYQRDISVASVNTLAEGYSDWLTEHGADYLKWHAVCSLNYLVPTYVFRQSGAATPPEKARDQAKTSLYEWDSFLWEQGRSPNAVR